MLSDNQLLRYSRQIMLGDVDIEGQQRWLDSRVLILGVGGLGSPVAMYLAAAGVGHLVLVDDDQVEMTNLQRQIAHNTASIGQSKVESAAATLAQINPDIEVTTRAERLDEAALMEQVANVDLVVDCTDNFTTRFMLNRACVAHKKPLVSGAAIRMEGQISVYHPGVEGSPCYQCLYKEGEDEALTCSEAGVLSPLVGIIGSMQALEALKVLASIGTPLIGRLLLLDAKHMEWRSLKLSPDPECPTCQSGQ
ncbi:molybdopterin-synthase adenylyltransferase MoeB [Neptunomonas phycophila]|uniref:Molybdopterin-synthase adenylyltransferase n=1 Tax=Neptunomonas phycophila TaxID=1572645 RepID=A0AAW7XMT0_9GAMM|nr:molybdopterin-synthase adenylyltransferase MoeB [Neptunomonas phycophila]MDO6454125.1 molybdopterin-synthase adenylyltransferase MoeB [Neptunomonas phycophila]MDO6468652.1 molybdopterin-synthase adenylyltransferase MoeB [Neptunomonas phycophila]MDP2523278.1 molybdopterin-synthase adenylyltransferase MoeB [Neptunomonas phycophila]